MNLFNLKFFLFFISFLFIISSVYCLNDHRIFQASELMLKNLAKFHWGSLKCDEGLKISYSNPSKEDKYSKTNINAPKAIFNFIELSKKIIQKGNVEAFEEDSDFTALLKKDNPKLTKMYNSISSDTHKIPEEESQDVHSIDSYFSIYESYKRYNKNIKKNPMQNFLNEFSPFVVFEESWMNSIMFSFIEANFSEVKDIYDPQIYDAFELARIKFLLKVDSSDLSADMRSLIFYFMHELIYGIDEFIPITKYQWRSLFVQKLLIHDMPRSTDYYLKLANESIDKRFEQRYSEALELRIRNQDEANALKQQIANIVTFFITKPEDWELSKFYKDNIESNLLVGHYAKELKMAALKISHIILISQDQNELQGALVEFIKTNSFSQAFLDRFPDRWISLDDWHDLCPDCKDIRVMRAIFKKLIPDATDPIKYLWTRDSLNPFSFNHFTNVLKGSVSSALLIIESKYPSLTQIDIFKQIIRSCVYEFQSIQNSKNSLLMQIYSKSPIFFKLFLNDYANACSTSINMFVNRDPEHKIMHIFNYDLVPDRLEKIKIYIEYIKKKTDDPLPLFFIKIENLRKLKERIVNRFNLKKCYKFDHNHSIFYSINNELNLDNWKIFRGKVLSFKEIIDLVNIKDLIEIFTSQPEILFPENSENDIDNDFSSAPISISKFINKGVFEPVDERNCLIS